MRRVEVVCHYIDIIDISPHSHWLAMSTKVKEYHIMIVEFFCQIQDRVLHIVRCRLLPYKRRAEEFVCTAPQHLGHVDCILLGVLERLASRHRLAVHADNKCDAPTC